MKIAALALALLLMACSRAPAVDAPGEEAAIRQVIADMEAAWNHGDFRSYMNGFKNPDTMFIVDGQVMGDWQSTLDELVREYHGSPERSGQLHLQDLRIQLLAPDVAHVIHNWRVERAEAPEEGIATRLMRKIDGRWVVVVSHVSRRDPAAR